MSTENLAHTGEHAGEFGATAWQPEQVQSGGGAGAPTSLAKALGWFSIGLGAAQLIAPQKVARMVGAPDTKGVRAFTRLMGLREIGHGVGILTSDDAQPWVWSRVAGDVLDIGALGAIMRSRNGDAQRAATALVAVAGTTLADLVDAIALTRVHGDTTDTLTQGPVPATNAPMRVKAAVTINRSATDIYRYWRDFENLPDVMTHLQSVEHIEEGRSHWSTRVPIGTVSWEAEIVEDVPDQLVRWRSIPGSMVTTAGEVRLKPAPRDRGTELHVLLEYHAPVGPLSTALLKLFGDDPVQQVKDDIRRFKQVMETGQVVRTDGTPRGTDARLQPKQRPAQPVPN